MNIVILGASALATAQHLKALYPQAMIHGLRGRADGAERHYDDFGEHLRALYRAGQPLVVLCAAGIVIRSLAALLAEKGAEPPVLALAEDGSAVVPLLGGLAGVNRLAREIAERTTPEALVECQEAIAQCRERLAQQVQPAVAFNGMLGRIRLACKVS